MHFEILKYGIFMYIFLSMFDKYFPYVILVEETLLLLQKYIVKLSSLEPWGTVQICVRANRSRVLIMYRTFLRHMCENYPGYILIYYCIKWYKLFSP
jgi:hypothetical protein